MQLREELRSKSTCLDSRTHYADILVSGSSVPGPFKYLHFQSNFIFMTICDSSNLASIIFFLHPEMALSQPSSLRSWAH